MLVKTFAGAVQGVDAQKITVEINVGGTPQMGQSFYNVVGLPDSAIKEGFHRIETALKHIGLKMPRANVVVNLAPANIRKEGSYFDLPIAIGLLAGSNQVKNAELEINNRD